MSTGAHPFQKVGPEILDEKGPLGWCTLILGLMCAFSLLFIMGLTFADVFMRYWFSAPITGSSEMVMFAMAILIFSAFPLVTLREQHISVGIMRGKLHGFSLWFQRLIILMVSLLSCAAMAWQLVREGQELRADQQITQVLELPLGTLSMFMGTMSGVATAALLLLVIRHCVDRSEKAKGRLA
jgi:TRAP-type C4-dicarboxylate transport system permease small subunit